MEEVVNWLDIPEEINHEIASRIQFVDDLVRFGAVCKSWQSSSVDVRKRRPHTPWLMLPESSSEEGNSDNYDKVRKFYCLSSKRVFKIPFPEAIGKRCLGTRFGWLLTTGLDAEVHLLNPLTHSQLPLPSARTFGSVHLDDYDPEQWRLGFVYRFAMSSHPSSPSCTVMVVYAQINLAIATPGAKAWTHVQCPPEGGAYEDVIFFKDKFYAVSTTKMLRVCEDIHAPLPKLIDVLPAPEEIPSTARFYLVEVAGDLHLVVRYFDVDEDAPEDVLRFTLDYFDVYKLDFGSNEWVELDDLGEYAIFVGTHSAFSISTLDHPKLKANSIYFTDDYCESYSNGDGGGRDMGIYDFGEDTIEPFYQGDDILSTFCTPMLFMPNFN